VASAPGGKAAGRRSRHRADRRRRRGVSHRGPERHPHHTRCRTKRRRENRRHQASPVPVRWSSSPVPRGR